MDRRATRDAYKERKSVAGIYALRSGGEVWVGSALDIEKVWNRLAFSLESGRHPRAALQAAWTQRGREDFRFEILERLAEPPSDYVRDAALKDRSAFWRHELGAAPV